jgi:hypothetical protein
MDEPTPTASTTAPADQPADEPADEPRKLIPRDWYQRANSAAHQAADIAELMENPRWLARGASTDSGPRATTVHGAPPGNVAAISDMAEHTAEIRAFLDELKATPKQAARTADWYGAAQAAVDDIGDAGVQAELDALAWRHTAKTAIRIGDYRPITHTLCPGCSTWGLRWLPAMTPHAPATPHMVVCLNLRCQRPDGTRRTYTLHQLARLRTQRSGTAAAAN